MSFKCSLGISCNPWFGLAQSLRRDQGPFPNSQFTLFQFVVFPMRSRLGGRRTRTKLNKIHFFARARTQKRYRSRVRLIVEWVVVVRKGKCRRLAMPHRRCCGRCRCCCCPLVYCCWNKQMCVCFDTPPLANPAYHCPYTYIVGSSSWPEFHIHSQLCAWSKLRAMCT